MENRSFTGRACNANAVRALILWLARVVAQKFQSDARGAAMLSAMHVPVSQTHSRAQTNACNHFAAVAAVKCRRAQRVWNRIASIAADHRSVSAAAKDSATNASLPLAPTVAVLTDGVFGFALVCCYTC